MIPRDEGEAAQSLSHSAQSLIAFMRWVSALVVVAAHLRAVLFVGYGSLPPEAQLPAIAAFYAATAFSHEAVIAFFVLSGSLVGGLNLRKAAAGRFNLSLYGIDRFTRIYVTFLPALILTIVLDLAGRSLLGWTGFYDGTNILIAERFPDAFQWHEPILAVLGNVAMLQPIYVPVLGSNVPLWSLSYEVWFYLWFAIFAGAFLRRSLTNALIIAAATLALAAFFGWIALYYLVIWCLGALALTWNGWPRTVLLPMVLIAASLAFASIDAADFWLGGRSAKYSDLPLGIGVAWLVAAVSNRQHPILRKTANFNRWTADFSYSLYLIHFPTMLVVAAGVSIALGLDDQLSRGFVPSAWSLTLYLVTIAVVFVLALLFSRIFERRTASVRQLLRTSLAGRSAGPGSEAKGEGR